MYGGILTKFKLIQALVVVLIVCKNEEAQEWSQHFSLSLWGFFQTLEGR